MERVLTDLDVPHDVKIYPGVGHGFMNDCGRDAAAAVPRTVSGTEYDAEATQDARTRITAFFDRHLRRPVD